VESSHKNTIKARSIRIIGIVLLYFYILFMSIHTGSTPKESAEILRKMLKENAVHVK
jgi:hypothetical protein